MKKSIFLALLVFSFFFGLSTGYYQHFPFRFIRIIKAKFVSPSTPFKRNIKISLHEAKSLEITENTGVYLTYGQSNSTNHGQIGYKVKKDVYQFFEGVTYLYKDPSLGGTGVGGSVWGMVGDKLINQGVHDKVIFSNCGMGASKIEDLNSGQNFDYLLKNYQSQIEKFGRVSGILFHQGESNNSLNGGSDNYYNDFVKFLNELKKNGVEIPIYLSRVSICGDQLTVDKKLIEIQNKIIRDFDNVYEGPNTDLLNKAEYRLPDFCHFSMVGFDKFSDMWVSILLKNHSEL